MKETVENSRLIFESALRLHDVSGISFIEAIEIVRKVLGLVK